jgi:hypothetical protein
MDRPRFDPVAPLCPVCAQTRAIVTRFGLFAARFCSRGLAANSLKFMVGATGIEPVTPTMSTLSYWATRP